MGLGEISSLKAGPGGGREGCGQGSGGKRGRGEGPRGRRIEDVVSVRRTAVGVHPEAPRCFPFFKAFCCAQQPLEGLRSYFTEEKISGLGKVVVPQLIIGRSLLENGSGKWNGDCRSCGEVDTGRGGS